MIVVFGACKCKDDLWRLFFSSLFLTFFCLSDGFNIPCQHAIPEKVLVSPEVQLSVDFFAITAHVFFPPESLPPLQRVRVIAYVFIVLSFWLM